jgi:hypothetical protein
LLEQFAHTLAQQGVGVLHGPGPFRPGGVDHGSAVGYHQQGHFVWNEPRFSPNLHKPVEGVTFFATLQQPLAEGLLGGTPPG